MSVVMAALLQWLLGFGLTLVVEGPCYLLGAAACGWLGSRRRVIMAAGAVVIVNLVTHPVLWSRSRSWTTVTDLALGELVVVVVEGLLLAVLLRRRRWARDLGWALLLALAANAASVLAGVIILP